MNILSRRWKGPNYPKKILAIRLQAIGDVVITLPYLQQVRNSMPLNTKLDLLTRQEADSIPKSLQLFDAVYSIGGGRNFKKQVWFTLLILPKLLFRRYDVIMDLQNNILSRTVMKILMPKAWSLFDRFSPVAAGERTRLTIEAIGLGKCFADSAFILNNQKEGLEILLKNGWKNRCDLVVLNPAGAFPTRNWEIRNYVAFAQLWLKRFPDTQFLVIGTAFIEAKANILKQHLGDDLINLVGQTTTAIAFSVLQHAKFVLSEDSGLMHMAWVSGIPTIALFGSTQSAKARPLGDFTSFLDSSDLPCGSCLLEQCKYADTHCLSRYTPPVIYDKSIALLIKHRIANSKKIHHFYSRAAN
jgi:heptosyltransferase II